LRILTLNCGSSTLKFDVIEVRGGGATRQERCLASGAVDRIGGRATIEFTTKNGECLQETAALPDHGEATRRVVRWLRSCGLLQPDSLDALGHRVVHGGDRFVEPTLIDDEVIETIEALGDVAPLHNEPSLQAIRAARAALGQAVPMVAVFDTAFHNTMPQRASQYAIPHELAARHHVRRYGFHGLAHRYMTERYAAITSTPVDRAKLITLQLGNGCSVTAVDDRSLGMVTSKGQQ
jgi:acetate kinase